MISLNIISFWCLARNILLLIRMPVLSNILFIIGTFQWSTCQMSLWVAVFTFFALFSFLSLGSTITSTRCANIKPDSTCVLSAGSVLIHEPDLYRILLIFPSSLCFSFSVILFPLWSLSLYFFQVLDKRMGLFNPNCIHVCHPVAQISPVVRANTYGMPVMKCKGFTKNLAFWCQARLFLVQTFISLCVKLVLTLFQEMFTTVLGGDWKQIAVYFGLHRITKWQPTFRMMIWFSLLLGLFC